MSTSKVTGQNSASLLADLSSSFDHAPWAVTELSGEAHIVRYANSAFCRLIDKARDEVIGSPFDRLLPPADECLALLDRVFRTGAAASYTAEEQAVALPSPVFLHSVAGHGRRPDGGRHDPGERNRAASRDEAGDQPGPAPRSPPPG